jgi:hypothetical protein
MSRADLSHRLFSATALSLLLTIGGLFLCTATPAPAEALCEDQPITVEGEETCGVPESIPITVEGKSSKAQFTGSSFEVTCESTTAVKAEKDLGGGKGLEGKMTSLLLGGCKGTCSTVTALNLNYKALITATGEGNGTLALSSGGSGNPSFEFKSCSFGATCTYGAEKPSLSIKGGETALIEATKTPYKKTAGSGFCPAEGSFTASYTVANLSPLFVAPEARPATRFCEEFAAVCPGGQVYDLMDFTFGLIGEAVFIHDFEPGQQRERKCASSTLNFQVSRYAAPIFGLTTTFSFGMCGGCPVTVEQGSFSIEVEADDPVTGNGDFLLRSNLNGPPKFQINCGAPQICYYEPKATENNQIPARINFDGFLTSVITITNAPLKKTGASNAECGATATMTATFRLNEVLPGVYTTH